MIGPERFRRHGPLLELAPGCWICVAGVTAILPAEDGSGRAVVEADGRPYVVSQAQAVMARVVADAMLDWARERAQAEEEGRLLALEGYGAAAGDDRGPSGPDADDWPTA
jgi:hypothetical protein